MWGWVGHGSCIDHKTMILVSKGSSTRDETAGVSPGDMQVQMTLTVADSGFPSRGTNL